MANVLSRWCRRVSRSGLKAVAAALATRMSKALEAFAHPVEHGVQGLWFAEVGLYQQNPAAQVRYRRDGGLRGFRVAAKMDDDVGAFFRQPQGDGAHDAARASGDQGRLAGKPHGGAHVRGVAQSSCISAAQAGPVRKRGSSCSCSQITSCRWSIRRVRANRGRARRWQRPRCRRSRLAARLGLDEVCLVEHDEAWGVAHVEVAKDAFHRLDVVVHVRAAGVHDVQQQVGVVQFVQGRTKRGHQIGGQIPHEADRIGNDHLEIAGKTQPPARRVKGGKHAIFNQHLAVGEGVQQCGLAGVGVAHDGEHRQVAALALAAAQMAALRNAA